MTLKPNILLFPVISPSRPPRSGPKGGANVVLLHPETMDREELVGDLKKCDACGQLIRPGQASEVKTRLLGDGKGEVYRVHTDKKDCPAR
jgi:hypothetical protein